MYGLASSASCPAPLGAGDRSALTCNSTGLSTPALGLPRGPERSALFALLAVLLLPPPPWLLEVMALVAAVLAAVLAARALAVFAGWLQRAVLLARLPHPPERAWLLGDLASMVRRSDRLLQPLMLWNLERHSAGRAKDAPPADTYTCKLCPTPRVCICLLPCWLQDGGSSPRWHWTSALPNADQVKCGVRTSEALHVQRS